jgi:hypothetical protein
VTRSHHTDPGTMGEFHHSSQKTVVFCLVVG